MKKITTIVLLLFSALLFVGCEKESESISQLGTEGKAYVASMSTEEVIITIPNAKIGEMCGGIAGIACETGGTCHIENNYPDASGVCTEDIKVSIDYNQSDDSPFGLQAPFCMKNAISSCSPPENYSEIGALSNLSDIGVKWVRSLESSLDAIESKLSDNNINILVGISGKKYPKNIQLHLNSVKKTIKKHADVKVWHIVNEADWSWQGTEMEYADFFIKTSELIKSECADCLVVLNLAGGQVVDRDLKKVKGLVFLDRALKNNVGQYFDVLDIHFQGSENKYIDLKLKLEAYKEVLTKNGFSDKDIWITEYATYDGDPTPDSTRQMDYSYQSETQQASGLVKKYVYGLSLGVKKMFWTTMFEWYKYNNNTDSYFSNVGLIHNPDTDGKDWKKLAYYSYKIMVEKLEGSDWDNIETIQESENIYVYKFTNKENGEATWVAWSDSDVSSSDMVSANISLDSLGITNAKITKAVPEYKDGKEIVDNDVDYSEMFNEYVANDFINLSDVPVFIEEREEIIKSNLIPTFFMIHFEVGGADNNTYKSISKGSDTKNLKYQEAMWNTAIKIVNEANKHNFKLTLAFNPQWAEYILKDSAKTLLVKEWQKNGHEIAFHHHGYDHLDWNGFSNNTDLEVLNDSRYRGNADEGFEYVKRLAEPESVITGTITDTEIDSPNGIEIITYGGGIYGDGPLSDAVSKPFLRKVRNNMTTWVGHGLLNAASGTLIEKIENIYDNSGAQDEIFGLVMHAHNFYTDSTPYTEWLNFIDSKGNKIQTLGSIIETGGGITIKTESVQHSFGIHPSSLDNYKYAKDLGLNINREGHYFIWTWLDIEGNGNFSFKKATTPSNPKKSIIGRKINYDNEQITFASEANIEIMRNVCPFWGANGLNGEFKSDKEKLIYQQFVERLVERYDGDFDLGCTQSAPDCYNLGDNEYPDQSLIDSLKINPTKYWQVCNAVTGVCSGEDCNKNNNYAIKYAEVQKLTYLGVKSSCSDCLVIIGGDSPKKLYPPIYGALNGEYIDVIDKHFFGNEGDYIRIKEEMDFLKESLQKTGFNLNELKFWITETGTYSGDPVDAEGKNGKPKIITKYQSETQQAKELVKRYVFSFGEGVEKILWAWGTMEGFHNDCYIFDYTGIIYDGNNDYECNLEDPYDRGRGVKKLAYYSFKLMIDKIGDFTDIEIIKNSNDTYVYKITNKDTKKIVWVAWSENSENISLEGISNIIITESVPNADSGFDLNESNYPIFFETQTKSTNNGSFSIDLSSIPVFIEEI